MLGSYFGSNLVLRDVERDQCPTGMDVQGAPDVQDAQGSICENKQTLMRKWWVECKEWCTLPFLKCWCKMLCSFGSNLVIRDVKSDQGPPVMDVICMSELCCLVRLCVAVLTF